MGIIFRVDDVSQNTDLDKLEEICQFLTSEHPDCEIWLCVNIFSRKASNGSVYPDLPLRPKPKEYFADVDQTAIINGPIILNPNIKIVSHGLFHFNHGEFKYDTQLFSIVPSCKILNTNIFVPPFTCWNDDTEKICSEYGITLIKGSEEGWKSLESEYFNPDHKKWFFHPWRFDSIEQFKERFSACKVY